MLIRERHEIILKKMHEDGRIKARDIEEMFQIAFDTARRDLRILEDKGLLRRTHGGAIPLVKVGQRMIKDDVTDNERAIVRGGESLVDEGDVIFLLDDPLNHELAKALNSIRLTVVTNSLDIANELKNHDKITLYLVGGLLTSNHPSCDHFAIEMIKQFSFDKVFLTSDGLSLDFGLSIDNSDQITFLRCLIENAREVIGLYAHEKINHASLIKVGDVSDLTTIVTDWDIREEDYEGLKELGIDVLCADQNETIYQKLKEDGYSGWGGKKFDDLVKGWQKKIDVLVEQLPFKTGSILEMGCGTGEVVRLLDAMNFEVTGIDISNTAIDWANEKGKGNYLCLNACDEHLLEGESYDLIIDGCCLHCLFKEDREAYYKNVYRLLNEGGYFHVNSAVLKKQNANIPKLAVIERCVVTQEVLENELERHGFESVKTWLNEHKTHNHFTGLYKKRRM